MDANPVRRCGTCRHFEQSGSWNRGWCRNTLLFSPGQSQIVQTEELFCSRGSHDFWEPERATADEPKENAGQRNVKLPTLSSPLKLFSPAPAGPALGMAGATGSHMMFASSGGGRGGNDDYDQDDYGFDDDFGDEPPLEPEDEPTRRPRSARTVRSGAAGATGGQPRTAQHQPDERYWTDYLRIALPVIGLLLMIGLLWFWATQLIGDSPETTDPATEEVGLVNESTPAPTNEAADVQGQTTDPENNTIGIGQPVSTPESPSQGSAPTQGTTVGTDQPAGDNQAEGEPETAPEQEEPAADDGFASGDPVVITEEGVNVRPAASLAGDPITMLNTGDQLTIASGPVEAEGYVWWEVILADGNAGWVVEDFIQPAG
jgi:hypothetical protein